MSITLKNALPFAKRGWKLFPAIWDTEKKRHIGLVKWGTMSTSEPTRLRAWAEAWPDAYFCVNLTASNLTVLDVDVKKGKKGDLSLKNLEYNNSNLPKTMMSTTPSKGFHYFFEGAAAHSVDKLGSGLDTPVMVPLPGSTLPGKGSYIMTVRGVPAPIPPWLKQAVGEPRVQKENWDMPICEPDKESNIKLAIDYLVNTAPEAEKGSGSDHTTYSIIARVRDFGIGADMALELMLEHWNEEKSSPPWPVEKLQQKVKNVYNYAKDQQGNATPEALFPAQVNSTAHIRCAAETNPDELKPRNWLLGNRYIPGYITLTVAPGGVGKSLLTICEGISVAANTKITHDSVKIPGAVWLYNTEDPFDELDRRVIAVARHYRLTREDFSQFYYSSGYESPLNLAAKDGSRYVTNEKQVDYLIKEIKAREVKLFILDPFVECHSLSENDNSDISFMVQIFRRIAKETNCAISLVHHTTKGTANAAGNMDKVRGASALASGARITHTLYTMTPKEATEYGIPQAQCKWYVRLDDAKENLSPPSGGCKWYMKKSVKLFFDNNETVGTLEPVELHRIEEVPVDEIIEGHVFNTFAAGDSKSTYATANEIHELKITGQSVRTIQRAIEMIFSEPVKRDRKSIVVGKGKGGNGNTAKMVKCARDHTAP